MGTTEMQIMAAVILCFVLALPLCTATAQGAVVEPAVLSKPGCKGKCGSVSVPFPFGMGDPTCFLDGWFELICDNSSTSPPKPILKHVGLEVLDIPIEWDYRDLTFAVSAEPIQQIRVRAPVSFSNCSSHKGSKMVSLTGAPFSFSSRNVFVAASCGVRAQVSSRSENMFAEIGCTSLCRGDNNVSNHEGISYDRREVYCEASLTSILDSYVISFDNDSTGSQPSDDECKKLAFVVDKPYWVRYKNETSRFDNIMSFENITLEGYVPLTMDWYMVNYSYWDYPGKNNECTHRSSLGAMCYCQEGYRGNPYLPEGCNQVIDTCKETSPCRWRNATCVNGDRGMYSCIDNSNKKRMFLFIGFGSAFGALFLLFATWGIYRKIKKRQETNRKNHFFKRNGGLLLQQQGSSSEGNIEKTKLFDSYELDKATDHFSVDRILGQGGQGTVYKGMLDDGNIIAVKKSRIVDEEKLSEFINEVFILSQINHRNVVKLLGCCLETEVPLLVYEFIPNGTLSQYIHGPNDEFPLTWKTRVRIASEVAGALSYLHSSAYSPIYHRDIKSTNILLDKKYSAKIADFGTSRTITLEQTHLTTLVYGTFGYLDPEYFQSSQFTDKSDVYSFGVVLVELITGQKVICQTRAEEGRNLVTYFIMTMEENRVFEIVDAQLLEEDGPQKDDILKVACLALRCLNMSGRNRPTMRDVAMELEGLRKSETEAPQKTYDEMDYVRTEVSDQPCEDVNVSTSFTDSTSASATSFVHQEIPLLSFGSTSQKIL